MSWRTPICQVYQLLMRRTATQYDAANLSKSTLVFSPHQDDETLGCGGTIIRKKRAGAAVKIIFMTDGCKSHAHLVSEAELKQIRAQEAVAAAQVLGLAPEDVIALNFTDGLLQNSQAEAVQAVISLLETHRPEEIFIPHHLEPPADHIITNQIVWAAMQQTNLQAAVYEYPVWFWDQYPWTNMILNQGGFLSKLKISLKTGFGSQLLTEMNCSVYIKDILSLKHKALNQHQSQMQPLIADSTWLTLGDLSEGEFLNCFFQDYEFFRLIKPADKA